MERWIARVLVACLVAGTAGCVHASGSDLPRAGGAGFSAARQTGHAAAGKLVLYIRWPQGPAKTAGGYGGQTIPDSTSRVEVAVKKGTTAVAVATAARGAGAPAAIVEIEVAVATGYTVEARAYPAAPHDGTAVAFGVAQDVDVDGITATNVTVSLAPLFPPSIDSMPAALRPGVTITIRGANFRPPHVGNAKPEMVFTAAGGGTAAVDPADISVVSDSEIAVKVPADAISGAMSVSVDGAQTRQFVSIESFDSQGWSPSNPRVPYYYLQPDSAFRVQQDRPRLCFRPHEIAWLKQRGSGPLAAQWTYLQLMASGAVTRSPDSPEAAEVKGVAGDFGQAVAFFALVEDNEAYRDWAVAWAKALGSGELPADDTAFRGRLQRMAVVYDWLYDRMSAEDRATLRAAIIRYVEAMQGWAYIANPSYVGGHERWGYAALAMALIALHGDYPGTEAMLLQCRRHIAQGFYPTQAWIASDGGYHMGWGYTSAYTTFDLPYLIWTVGTNDVLLDSWMADMSAYFLYGMRGDDTFPAMGDAYSTDLELGSMSAIYGAGLGKLGLARWFLENKAGKNTYAFLQLLLYDPAVQPEAPGPGLPMSKLFKQAGIVLARDSWGADATHFVFKSGAFYSLNHHHRDENTFTVHYKGPLAIDSGVYDSYSSSHWKNYYTRTIAHNGVVVFDPAQTMSLGAAGVSNDGGQVFGTEPMRLADLQAGGHAALGGILRYEDREAFTYALGDATKAYDSQRVTLAQREVVYLRQSTRPHPPIVVFDRIGATSGSLKKRFLLHTIAQPSVSGRVAVAEQAGGRLSLLSLYPPDAAFELVGGAGKEWWVDGANYPPGTTPDAQAGAWRLEIAPAAGQATDQLLQVLFVDDTAASPVTETNAALVSGTDALGVEVGGWTVVFPRAPSGTSALSYAAQTGGTATHLVTGLPPGTVLSLLVDGSPRGSVSTGAGGCAVFQLTVAAGAQIALR